MTTPHATHLIYAKLTLMALMWGGTFIAGRLMSGSLEPLPAATARFGVAVIGLLILSWHREGGLPRLTAPQALVTLALGLTGVFLYNLFFFGALSEMPASRTAIFVAFNPIAVALMTALVLREPLTPLKWAGIALALMGALIVISRGDLLGAVRDLASVFGSGEIMMLSAIVSWAVYTIVGRVALSGLSPLAATTYGALWGFALLLAGQLLLGDLTVFAGLGWADAGLVLYLAVGGTVIPFIWYYQGVKQLGPARTAVFTNFVPVFGVLLGVVLLGEALSASMLIGGGLVIAGVTLTNR